MIATRGLLLFSGLPNRPVVECACECMLETDWHNKFKEQITPVIQNVLATSDPVLDKQTQLQY